MSPDTPMGQAVARVPDAEGELEQQMRELDLSSDTCHFLREVHIAEKRLNDAFEMAHRGGDLQAQVSLIYHEFYGGD